MIKNNIVVQNNQHMGDIKVCVNYYFLNYNCSLCAKFLELDNHQKELVLNFIEEIEKKKIKEGIE